MSVVLANRPTLTTGIEGLDRILFGGLAAGRLYLLEGEPGTGKTTLALQFLLEGVERGEAVLYVTLSESVLELEAVAASHGWSLAGATVRELSPTEDALQPESQYTIFHPAEVELGQTIKAVLADFDQLRPSRLVIDSLSELRLLAGTSLRFRRQVLALKTYFSSRNCTVLMLDDLTAEGRDLQVQSIAHGVVRLEQLSADYGADRRRLRVLKYRGTRFREGHHDYVIRKGGLTVFPRLVAAEHRAGRTLDGPMASGLAELDALLGGGIDRGTSTLIMGAAGTGKSSLATLFAWAAALRGERAAFFLFDEAEKTLTRRAAGLGIDLRPHLDSGAVAIRRTSPSASGTRRP